MPLEYFILKPDGEQTGTFSLDQIKAMVSSGFIDGKTRYWHEGITEWKSVEKIDESLEFEKPATATRSLVHPSVRPLPGIQRPGAASRNWRKPGSAAVMPQRGAIPPPAIPTESQRIAKSASESTVTPTMTRKTGPVPTAEPLPAPNVPSASISLPPTTENERTPMKGTPVIETLPMPIKPTDLPKRRRVWPYLLSVVVLVLAALALFFVHRNELPRFSVSENKVTLSDPHVFVLLNQAAIRQYSDAMRDTSKISALQDQIAHTNNQIMLVSLKLGIEKEKARHVEMVQDQFLHSHDAERIDPGTYSVLGYVDSNGLLIDPRADDVWVAIPAKGQTVYAYLPPAPAPSSGPTGQ